MRMQNQLAGFKDKTLFTPGPMNTSRTVKQAMLRDLGSRDYEFIEIISAVRHQLLQLAGVSKEHYEAIIMQGSGTFGIESVIASAMNPSDKLLVIINGAYGRRIRKIAEIYQIPVVALEYPENEVPNPVDVEKILASDSEISHVALVHCETTTGILNPIAEIGAVVKAKGKIYFVDAMSSFGAVPIHLAATGIDFLVSSSNKCIEGVPGFSFVLVRTSVLLELEGRARSLVLDLFDQWKGLETNGQFRFTPPTHVILAFYQALIELEQEGGVIARAARYQRNHQMISDGMKKLGFTEYLPEALQSWIIASFHYPTHPNFNFETFYKILNEQGQVIYPGKLSHTDLFRIGSIGRIFPEDIRVLLTAVAGTLKLMDVQLLKTE